MIRATVDHPTGNWRGVAFGVGIASFAAYQQFKLPVVLPVLLETYGYPRTLAGAFVSVYSVAGLLLSLWLGRVIERFGAVVPILVAAALFTAGSLITLADPAAGYLVLFARGLEGLGFAVLAVTGPFLVNANASPRNASLVAGMSAAWIPIGQLTATGLAPLALATTGWSLLWWIGIAGAVLMAAVTLRLASAHDVVLAPSPSAGRVGSGLLSTREKLTLVLAACIFGLWSGQYFAYMTWLPQYLVEVHGLAVQGALVGYVVPVALVGIFTVVGGALLRAGVPLGGLMTGAIGVQVTVWWLLPVTGGGWGGLVSLVAYGMSCGLVPACLFSSARAVVGAGRSTAPALGILMTGRNLGVLIGPVLLAWVAGDGQSWDQGARVFAGITALAMTLAAVFWMRLRAHDAGASRA